MASSEKETGSSSQPVEDASSICSLLVPAGLEPDLHRTCEIVLKRGWPGIIWQRGFTGLHLAAKQGSEAAVRLLLHASAAPALTEEDCRKLKPIDYAHKKGFKHLSELLNPNHVGDLACGVVPYVEPTQQGTPQISEADKQELRDVYARKCKEVEKATSERMAIKYETKIKKLQAAVEAERQAKTQALEETAMYKEKISASTDAEKVKELEALVTAERSKRRDSFETLNKTMQDSKREALEAKEKAGKAEQEIVALKEQILKLKADLERAQNGAESHIEPNHELPPSRSRQGSEASINRGRVSTMEFAMSTFSVDLTQSDGVRTELPSLMEAPCSLNSTLVVNDQSRVSCGFWEDLLLDSRPRLDPVAEAQDCSPTSPPVFSPESRAKGKRHTIDCDIGEFPPNQDEVDIVGLPKPNEPTGIEVDLTNTLMS